MSRGSRIGRRRLRLKHAASLCTRRAHAAEFSEAPARDMFQHDAEAGRRRAREFCIGANRAAVLFRVGAPEGRSPALPFHISSRANARRDHDGARANKVGVQRQSG